MNSVKSFKLAALLAFLLVIAFPQSGASELKPETISPANWSGSAPRIASDGSGNVIVVWRELDDETAAIRAAFRPNNASFGP